MTVDPGSVLYVAGLGRSGSTLLERAVAQLPGVCGIGETVYMWERGVVNDERCGCGESFHHCPFWTAVGERAFGGWHRVDTRRIAQLQRTVDDVKHVPRMLAGSPGSTFREESEEYASYYVRLYDAVREVSGCSVVVDSSKITSLAYVLAGAPAVDLSMVHMLRDPRAVAHSWTKVVRRPEVTTSEAYMPRYSPAYMGMLYSGHHVLLELLRKRGVPTVTIRYEDFADAPGPAVATVADLLGVDFPVEDVMADARTLTLGTVHTASGNPSRFRTGDVEVRRDDGWRTDMTAGHRAVVSALTAPLSVAYRYSLTGRR